MRSGVTCVLLVLLIRREGKAASEDEFRPTPIPLNEWREVRGLRGLRASERPAPARAHYWEDALRHSVYLALVRDKIDHLIAKGHFDDPAQDIDDRDLWDKVKWAPFDKMDTADPATFGDVAIMAKGRLMEEPGGFRFTADDKIKNKCTQEKCTEGVKALWSVKRVRQRDQETTPGHYHYELTFSVVTQAHKKHKKHYEKPARTFTVRESDPERIMETPQENRYYEPLPLPAQPQTPRPSRALWFHKNILPPARSQARQHNNGLDRLFSSLFSDDDEDIPQTRYRPKQYIPQAYQQYSKVGYVGSPSEHQQKKLNPYGPKPHTYKYSRPIPPPPPQPPHVQHHYLDIDAIGVVSNPYIQPQDHRYGPPNKQSKTPRPPVLPTPPNPVLPQKNFTFETTTKLKPNWTEETTQQPESVNAPHKSYSKQKPTTVKISYVTDHVRPPVYNAPPGVFVTMDKKPFKPIPPLRLVHSTKHHKTTRPVDFRPSPQVLDIQFSEPDPLFDTAFRPITVNYANSNTTEKAVAASDTHFRKPDTTAKKPPKKHEIVKVQRVTTTAPEIITAHSIEEDSDAEWANVLGAFAKTTPMAAEKEKAKVPETTTPLTTSTQTTSSTPVPTTTVRKRVTTTTEATSTTPKPKKRTRPPPKFAKPEKVKKHKRVTTTTTEVPEEPIERDLTPQASSAAATAKLSSSTTTSTTTTTTTTTTTQATTTPVQKTTTTEQPRTSTTTQSQPTLAPENEYTHRKNRYRQSTLKYRTTSGNDKKEEKARTILPPTGKFPPRRKGSKFQGHVPSSTPKNTDKQYDDQGRENHVVSPYKSKITTSEATTTEQVISTKPTTPVYEDVADRIYMTSASPEYSMGQEEDFDENSEENGEDEQESREHPEYVPSTAAALTPSEKANEIAEENEDEPLEVTEEVTTASTSTPKSKPKCKKKKHNNLNNTSEETKSETTEPEILNTETTTVILTTTTTEKAVTPDIFQEIFGGFTFDDSPAESQNNGTTTRPELEQQETTNQERFVKAEEDFEDFFEAFDDKDRHPDGKFEDQYEYDDKEPLIDDEESLFQSEEDRRSPRDSRDEEAYDDYQEPPYSLLELMAME